MEWKMPNEAPDWKHEPATSKASQPSYDRGPAAALWLLALLIAEIEFRTLAFAHMYRT
jgi:hypothetical protein